MRVNYDMYVVCTEYKYIHRIGTYVFHGLNKDFCVILVDGVLLA